MTFSAIDSLEFVSDISAPYLQARNPAPGTVGVATDTAVYGEIVDSISNLDAASIILSVDQGTGVVTAYTGGGWVNGFSGVVNVSGLTGDYSINAPVGGWPEFQVLVVGVLAADVLGNILNTSYSMTTADEHAPVIDNEAPTSTTEPVDIDVSFTVTDPASGVDWGSLGVSVGGTPAVVSGIAQGEFSLSVVGDEVIVSKSSAFVPLSEISVSASVSDAAGNQAQSQWQFAIDGAIVAPVLYATATGAPSVVLSWTLPPPSRMPQLLFEVRRSTTAAPVSTQQGQLVYSGSDRGFTDTDVDVGVRYYYTVFVITGYESGSAVYAAYDPVSSADAVPRAEAVKAAGVLREYVPGPGELGQLTMAPVTGHLEKSWTKREQFDIINSTPGAVISSPVAGVVTASGDQVTVTTPRRLSVSISGMIASVASGVNVSPGQALGRVARSGSIRVSATRPATDSSPEMTVRPEYVYRPREKRPTR